MLAKTWKKIGLIILIIACLWNIVGKLVHRISFDNAIEAAKAQMQSVKTQIQIKLLRISRIMIKTHLTSIIMVIQFMLTMIKKVIVQQMEM